MKKLAAFVVGAVVTTAVVLALASCGGVKAPVRPMRDAGLERVHFATGSDVLSDEARRVLRGNVGWLQRHPRTILVLEGHCDERGDAAYNMQLGDRRARRVKEHLIASNVDEERLIMVVSHGELHPLDERHNRDAWRRNRRVEFIVR